MCWRGCPSARMAPRTAWVWCSPGCAARCSAISGWNPASFRERWLSSGCWHHSCWGFAPSPSSSLPSWRRLSRSRSTEDRSSSSNWQSACGSCSRASRIPDAAFKRVTPAKFGGSNEETFNAFDQAKWDEVRQNLDKVLTELEKLVSAADEKTLQSWGGGAPTLGRLAP